MRICKRLCSMCKMKKNENIILIGMPGAGKSTVGVVVAKKLGYRFTDSDLVIQETYGMLLHELIEEHGVEGFVALENDVNASLTCHNTVIATGGSACYGKRAMTHLREMGVVVFLNLGYDSLSERLGDLNARGVVIRQGQSLRDLYEERIPLYRQYADITVDCEGRQLREVAEEVCAQVMQVWESRTES